MIGGPKPSVCNIEGWGCGPSLKRVSPRPRVGMLPTEGQVAVTKGVPRRPRTLLDSE